MLTFRNAKELASLLQKEGIQTGGIKEPNKEVDGMIVISKNVHIQVPLYGNEPNVVRVTDDGKLDFGDQKRKMSALISDINLALAGQPLSEDEE
ncbi:hypothetical protein [Denitratisoma oestradiolicum]|uniref:Uncharacterized protein n=1 Tax=Denitratisoma oestradiolicum TaxID=311182 RepID=A0A6S6Y4K4_9PROT|nr:hypothetical protein [Denitratisoma oestradiolicum]TWO78913.1 hypothetical protein CBW56_17585 [Denitratisoma oestradiolicum]CAB1367538.1 conserved protein of unknown function [Denitratisoma oestradiolicum]